MGRHEQRRVHVAVVQRLDVGTGLQQHVHGLVHHLGMAWGRIAAKRHVKNLAPHFAQAQGHAECGVLGLARVTARCQHQRQLLQGVLLEMSGELPAAHGQGRGVAVLAFVGVGPMRQHQAQQRELCIHAPGGTGGIRAVGVHPVGVTDPLHGGIVRDADAIRRHASAYQTIELENESIKSDAVVQGD